MARFTRYGERQAPVVWGGGGGGMSGAAPASTPGAAANAGSGRPGSGWVNVQDYLSANKTQADKMGADVASQLDTQAASAAKDANNYRSDVFKYTTDGGPTSVVNPEWTKMQNMMNDWRQRGWTDGHISDVISKYFPETPAPWIPDPSFKPLEAPAMPATPGDTLEKIKSYGTPAGLSEYYAGKAGPTYTVGQGNLDSFLASAGSGGQAIQDLQGKWGKTLDIINNPYTGGRPPGDPGPNTTPPPSSIRPPADIPKVVRPPNPTPETNPAAGSDGVYGATTTPITSGRLPNNKKNALRWS